MSRRKYASVEELLFRYCILLENRSRIPSLYPFVFGERCAKCGARGSHALVSVRGRPAHEEGYEKCIACGKAWEGITDGEAALRRDRAGASRAGQAEDAMIRIVDRDSEELRLLSDLVETRARLWRRRRWATPRWSRAG